MANRDWAEDFQQGFLPWDIDAAGIATDVHYPFPITGRAFPEPPESVDLPVTERATGRIFLVPTLLELRDDEIDRVCDALGPVTGG